MPVHHPFHRLPASAPSRRARELLLVLATDRAATGLRVNELAAVADLPRSVVGSTLTELEALGAVVQRAGTSVLSGRGHALADELAAGPAPPKALRRSGTTPAPADGEPADDAVLGDVRRLQAARDTGALGPGPVQALEELEQLAELARRWSSVPCALITLVDEQELHAVGAAADPSLPDLPRRLPVDAGPCRDVVTHGRELIAPDAATDPVCRRATLVRDGAIGAYLGIPLRMAGGEVIGALCLVDPEPRAWSEQEIGVARTLAGVVQARLRLRALPRRAAM